MQIFKRIFSSAVLLLLIFTITPCLFSQELVPVTSGYQFTEGPVWKDGVLYFSDIKGDKIFKWSADSGATPFLDPSGRSNGLTLDLEGRIIIAGHSARNIARIENKDSLTILASHYNGNKFNSPNDIVVKSDGGIFFTDPMYGLNDIGGTPELNFRGIFRISPAGEVQLLDKTLDAPNGICFSPDESLLYVAESNPFIRKIYVWDVINDSTIANKREFAYVNTPNCYLDGMKVDETGRLYSCSVLGVVIFESDGTPIDTIDVPGSTTNCTWGGEDGKTLFITAGGAVYKYQKSMSGLWYSDKNKLNSFCLDENYPNPFNALTIIDYTIRTQHAASLPVELSVYDILGHKIAMLVNRVQKTGRYTVTFNGGNLPSGMYYYQLQAGDYSQVRKMTLLK